MTSQYSDETLINLLAHLYHREKVFEQESKDFWNKLCEDRTEEEALEKICEIRQEYDRLYNQNQMSELPSTIALDLIFLINNIKYKAFRNDSPAISK